ELHPHEVVLLRRIARGCCFFPVLVRIGELGEVVVARVQPRDLELLEWSRLVILVGPSDREALQVTVALEVAPRHRLLRVPGQTGELDVDEAKGRLDSRRDLGTALGN